MKICIITPIFKARYKSIRFNELVKRFVRRGHEVHVITKGRKSASEHLNNLFIHYLPVNDIAMKVIPSFSYHVRGHIRRICEDYDIDIVEAHHHNAFGLTRSYLGTPVIAQVAQVYTETLRALRSFKLSELSPKQLLNRVFYVPNVLIRMDLAVCRSSDMIITSCNHAKRNMVNMGIPESKIRIVSGGVDTKKFRPLVDQNTNRQLARGLHRKGGHIILSVGYIDLLKGFRFLIKALKLLKRKYRRLMCVIAGGGDLTEILKLRRLAYRLGVHDSLIILGHVSYEKMPYVYSISDIVVLPSLREGTPLVLLEAMACGKPVVATRVGGIPEIIEHGEDGLLVRPKDVEGLSKAILTLLEDPGLREEMGKKARRRAVKEFDWDIKADEVIRVYKEVLQGGPEGA